MGGIQPWHIILVVVVFILLFGGKKLPDAARGLGRSLRILKSEVGAMHEDDGKPKTASETDATALVPSAPTQISPTPLTPTVVAPVAAPTVQVPGAAPVAAPVPVLNGQGLHQSSSPLVANNPVVNVPASGSPAN